MIRIGENLSDEFPVQNGLEHGHVRPPLLFDFALQCDIVKVEGNKDGLELNGTY
jgi:hypothetical protein